MKRHWYLALTWLIIGAGLNVPARGADTPASADFYVSVAGNDANPGTVEKPFATLMHARDEIRHKIRIGLTADLTVLVRGGSYELNQPLQFGPEDSGTKAHSITYAAYPGEEVIISGGRPITNWQVGDGPIWTAEIPAVQEGRWNFRSLFINGQRARRARRPNINSQEPYYRLTNATLSNDHQSYQITLPAGTLANWKNFSEIEAVIFGSWEIARLRVLNLNLADKTISLTWPIEKANHANYPQAGASCYLENARAFMDMPGEWYLDRKAGVLSYWPLPGQDLPQATVIAPVLTKLMEVKGVRDHIIQNLHFKGLSFAYCNWELPPGGYAGGQACTYNAAVGTNGQAAGRLRMDDAIVWEFVHSCSLQDCEVAHVEQCGFSLRRGCKDNLIQGCRIYDIGANGLLVGEQSDSASGSDFVENNLIANNEVHSCGVSYHGGVGIWVGLTDRTFVLHNWVSDLPYTGISVGWQWNSQPTECKNNHIECNEISNVMKMLSDGGGIYTLGLQPETVIRGNVIHDVVRNPNTAIGAPNNGFFFDEGSKGFHVEDNVIYKTAGESVRFNQSSRELHTFGLNYFGENAFYKGRAGGYARAFTNDRFMEIPHAPALDPHLLTLETWIKPLAFAGGNDPSYWLVSKNGSELTDGHYSLLMSHNNVGAYLNIGGGRENVYSAWSHDNPIRSNEWSHVAMTYDGADLKVYCNGRLAGFTKVNRQETSDHRLKTEDSDLQSPISGLRSNVSGLSRSPGTGALYLGKRSDGNNSSFNGLMDDVRIYSRALSAEEIAAETIDYGREKTLDARPQTQVSSLKSNVSSLTSNLVLHLDFTAMHDRMEKIIAEAGPEEPYRSRFREQKSAISGQPTASSLKSGEDRSQKPEIKDQKTETGEEKKNAD